MVRALFPLAFAGAVFAADSARPPIIEAARTGDQATVRALLSKKAAVNAADGDGSTALHWAAHRNDLVTAELLIRAGANVNAATDLGVTALWTASENGSAPMVRALLAAGANPNLALLAGETPLMVASRGGYTEVVEQLLAKGANPNAHGTRNQTALMWAVLQSHPEVVRVLLAHRADVHLKSAVWSMVMAVPPHGYLPYNKAIPHGGETAILFAARVNDLASAKLLAAAGANVKDADAWGVTAVTLAAHSGFTEMVEYLLDKGADPNEEGPGFTALHEAIMWRDERMVAALLDHGADVNRPLKTWTPTRRSSEDRNFFPPLVGATPYWMAARFLQPKVMRMLAAKGADTRVVHHAEWTADESFGHRPRKENINAVMAAAGMLRISPWVEPPAFEREALTLEAVKVALELGADINAVNTDGRTALDAAKTLRFDSVAKYLAEKGAQPGQPTPTR